MSLVKKIFFAVVLISITAASVKAQTYDELVEQYIAQYKPIAIEEMQRVHIPASITLAQGIVESSAGQSPLATVASNHFGIKCHNDWCGDTYYYDDDTKQECFRKYGSAAESFKDHSDFLTSKHRYEVLFTYNIMDYKAWAKGLKACGYATNPQYANVLIKCIEDYDLHQWDLSDADRRGWFVKINKADRHHALPVTKPIDHNDPEVASASRQPDCVFVFNNIKCITLAADESLSDVATDFEIGISRLMRYNDLTNISQTRAGDRIYLQPKRKNGDVKLDTVQPGETMFTLAREHGIQLKELYEKNKMNPGTQPSAGQILNLHETVDAPPLFVTAITDTLQLPLQVSADYAPETIHMVTKGDTLYSVSKKYNLTVEQLKEINHLYSEHLYVGQRLHLTK